MPLRVKLCDLSIQASDLAREFGSLALDSFCERLAEILGSSGCCVGGCGFGGWLAGLDWRDEECQDVREVVGYQAALACACGGASDGRAASAPWRSGGRRDGGDPRRAQWGGSLPGVRRGLSGLRQPASPLASSGHDAAPDAGSRGGSSGALLGAWRPPVEGALGGREFAVHGAVRGRGHRMASRGERSRGGGPHGSELGSGGGDSASRGGAGSRAAPVGAASVAGRGRDVVSAAPRVRDGGQRSGARRGDSRGRRSWPGRH